MTKIASECSAAKAQENLLRPNRRNALEVYEQCAEKYPNNVAVNRAAGLMAMILDEREKCLEYFSKVVNLFPDDALAREQYGDALMLNLRNDEAKVEYEAAIQKGHWDSDRIKIKIGKLVPKTDIDYIKRYLLGYQGMNIQDFFPVNVYYFDSKKRLSKNDFIYQQNPAPKNVALVDYGKIQNECSQLKKFRDYMNTWYEKYGKTKNDMEDRMKRNDKDTEIKNEFIKFVVTHEATQVVSRLRYAKLVNDELKRIAAGFAKQNGYDAVAGMGQKIEGKDVTREVFDEFERDKSIVVSPETIFSDAQKEIELNDENLQPDRFFRK